MTEREEYLAVKARVDDLMASPPLGDGVGPGNACFTVNEEFGTSYSPAEVWRIWRQGKAWARPGDDAREE